MLMVLITKAAGLIYKIKLTSLLGGSGMSCYSGAFAVFTPVFAAAAAGAPSAMSRLVSEQLSRGNYAGAVKIRRTATLIFLSLSALLSALLIIFSRPLADTLAGVPQARLAICAVSLSLVPAALMNVRRGWAEGLGSMNPTASSEIVETLLKLFIGVFAAQTVMELAEKSFEQSRGCFGKYCTDILQARNTAAPYAAAAAALGVSAASAAACIFIYVITHRSLRFDASEGTSFQPEQSLRNAVCRIMKFSVPSSAAAIIATLSGMADLVTITPGINEAMRRSSTLFEYLAESGIPRAERAGFVYGSYTGLALTIYGLVPTFTAMLGKSVLPSLTMSFSTGDRAEASRSVRSMLLLSSAVSMPCGIGVCLLADPILTLFFAGSSAEISVSAAPLSILGIASVFMGISLPCMSALQACDRQFAAVGISLAGTLIKLLLNRLLIPLPSLNICGAALSTLISQLFICIASVGLLISQTGSASRSIKALFTPLMPALLCGASALMLQKSGILLLYAIPERINVLFSITFGAIICFVFLALLCISPKNQLNVFFLKKNEKKT